MPESLTRRARPFELRAPAVVAGITSEQWPASVRNGGRLQIGIPAGFASEQRAGFRLECMAGFVGIRRWRGSTE